MHYRLLATAAVLLGAALLAWRLLPAPQPPVPATAAPAPAAPPGPVQTAAGPAAGPPALPRSAPAVPGAASAPPPEAELCGVGRVPLVPSKDGLLPASVLVPPDHLDRYAVEAARERVLAVLATGALRERLLARLWRDLLPAGAPRAEDVASTVALVNEAVASGDPLVHGSALRLCPAVPEAPDCQRRLVEAAVRHEPGNARWHAQRMSLSAEPEAAWTALLQAQAWRSGHGSLLAVARAALPPDLPPYVAQTLLGQVLALESALIDNYAPVVRRCRLDAPAAERAPRDQCDRLAHLMIERSDTVLTFALGVRVAEGAGWPAARLAALKAEKEALTTASPVPPDVAPLGCAAVDATARWLDQLAREGELAAARALLRR